MYKHRELTDKAFQAKLEKVLKGTTTVGMVFKDFTVLAADRRATSGFFISHKKAKKILKVDDHVATTISGYVGDAQWLVDQLRYYAVLYKTENNTPISIKSLANVASVIMFQNRPLLIAHVLIGGVDADGPALFSVDWLGSITREKYTATGSGSPFAVSILESSYNEELEKEEAVKLAVKAVRAALRRDPGSGEGVDVVVVSKEGYEEIRGEDIKL